MALQAGCPVMYVNAYMLALICFAAGPGVRFSVWHSKEDGTPNGWLEVPNLSCCSTAGVMGMPVQLVSFLQGRPTNTLVLSHARGPPQPLLSL